MKKQGCDGAEKTADASTDAKKIVKNTILELVTLASARFKVMPAVASAKWPDRHLIDDAVREANMHQEWEQKCLVLGVNPDKVLPFLDGLVEAAKHVQNRCFDLWEKTPLAIDTSEAITSPRNELDTINTAIIEVLSSAPLQTPDPELAQALFLELSSDLSLQVNDSELIDEEIISLIMNGAIKAFLR